MAEHNTEIDLDVFISYSHGSRDSVWARKLAKALKLLNLKVFIDEVDLPTRTERGLDDEIQNALKRCRLVLMCVGEPGEGSEPGAVPVLGPYQRQEIEFVRSLRAAFSGATKLPLAETMCLGNNITRDTLPDDWDGWLRQGLIYSFPQRDGMPSVREIALAIRRVTAGDALPDRDQDSSEPESSATVALAQNAVDAAKMLAADIRRGGLAIFVGPVWPDRKLASVFDPRELAEELLGKCGIDSGAVVSLDRAATLFSIYKRLEQRDASPQEDIRDLIREKVALRAPTDYVAICNRMRTLLDDYKEQGGSAKATILATSNTDSLLERQLVLSQVPFVLVSPIADGTWRQTHFNVMRDDDYFRLDNKLSGLEDDHLFFSREYFEAKKEQTERPFNLIAVTAPNTPAERKDMKHFDKYRGNMDPQQEEFEDEQLWRFCEIDRMVREHVESSSVIVDAGSATEFGPVHDWCFKNRVPIVLKLFGCVHEQSDDVGFDIGRTLKMVRSANWLPNQIEDKLLNAGTVLVGYSMADPSLLHSVMLRWERDTMGPWRYLISAASQMEEDDTNSEHARDATRPSGDPYDLVDKKLGAKLDSGYLDFRFPQLRVVSGARPDAFFAELYRHGLVD